MHRNASALGIEERLIRVWVVRLRSLPHVRQVVSRALEFERVLDYRFVLLTVRYTCVDVVVLAMADSNQPLVRIRSVVFLYAYVLRLIVGA